MNQNFLWLIAVLFFVSCKSPKKHHNTDTTFFPVLSFLQGQVSGIDSSLNRIIKVETRDNKSDTTFIKREDFKKYAVDFLNIPDIGSPKWKDDYEEARINDADLKSYLLTYTTNEKNNEIQKEDVMINPTPDVNGNNQVKTIIIDKWITGNDSSVHKNMVWETNNRFFIITKVEKPNQPEIITKLEVIWNNLPG